MVTIKTGCFVIHSRPFSDSRLILQLLTPHAGLISALYRLPSKKYTFRPKPFEPLMAHYKGDSSLKTLTSLEQEGAAFYLQGRRLFCGLYVNELVQRLLRVEDESDALFADYLDVLNSLATADNYPSSLRVFELNLLEHLGYAPDYEYDIYGEPILYTDDDYYLYDPTMGFKRIVFLKQTTHIFSGKSIGLLSSKNIMTVHDKAIKRFTRLALKPLLGHKPLKARSLFD